VKKIKFEENFPVIESEIEALNDYHPAAATTSTSEDAGMVYDLKNIVEVQTALDQYHNHRLMSNLI
jgi:hypothetical protein